MSNILSDLKIKNSDLSCMKIREVSKQRLNKKIIIDNKQMAGSNAGASTPALQKKNILRELYID